MKINKISIFYICFLTILFIVCMSNTVFAADPKLVSTINSAFEKIEEYIVKISTPAAAVAVGTGKSLVLVMKKKYVHLIN